MRRPLFNKVCGGWAKNDFKHRSKQGGGRRGGGVRLVARLTKGGGVPDFSTKGWGGTVFFSWEKEHFEESSVKRSILTTFAATKAQKRLNLDFKPFFAIFRVIKPFFGRLWFIFAHTTAPRRVRFG
jgi:hypothetical protein